jgi:hypothetical protein
MKTATQTSTTSPAAAIDFDTLQEYEESTNERDQQPESRNSFSNTRTMGKAFLNDIVALPNGGYAFEVAVLAGGKEEKSRLLYASLYASKRLQRFAESQVGIKYEAGTLCEVEILNLHAAPVSADDGRIYENYRGFLVGLSFG